MQDLTQGPAGSLILRFSLPMLIGNLFQQFYNMVDGWVVGNFVGKKALAAVGASFPVVFFMLALMGGLTMGANILIAQAYGAKKLDLARAVMDTTFLVLFWSGLVLSLSGILWAEDILRLLLVPREVLEPATEYLRIILGGSILVLGFNGVSAILRGLGDSKTPLYILIISTILNIILNLLFVLYFNWGIKGVAWATVISQGVSILGSMVYLNYTHPLIKVNLKKMTFHPKVFRLSMKIGLPTGAQQILVSLGIMFLTAIVNSFGANVMAGFTAATRIDSLAGLPAMNIGLAVSTFTGQNLGAGKPERVRNGYRAALKMGICITGALVILFFTIPEKLIGIFTQDHEVIRIGAGYLKTIAPFYLVFTLMFLTNGVLRGAGAVLVPFLTTLLAMWVVRVPAAVLFSFLWGVQGLWWAMPTGWIVGAGIACGYYKSGRWIQKRILPQSSIL